MRTTLRSVGRAVQGRPVGSARRFVGTTAPSPVSSLPPSPIVADADAGGGSDSRPRLGDAGYDPVVEAGELKKILGLSWDDRKDRDREAIAGLFGAWSCCV